MHGEVTVTCGRTYSPTNVTSCPKFRQRNVCGSHWTTRGDDEHVNPFNGWCTGREHIMLGVNPRENLAANREWMLTSIIDSQGVLIRTR